MGCPAGGLLDQYFAIRNPSCAVGRLTSLALARSPAPTSQYKRRETIMRIFIALSIIAVVVAPIAAQEKTWRAGVAKTVITPREYMWMSGYGGRSKPAEGKIHDLWAKALVLYDAKGNRGVIVTMDLVGIDR